VNYWNNYTDEVDFNMIQAIQKAADFALISFSDIVKVYAIFMKDGEKVYTDYAGFRKLLKKSRELGVELYVF